MNDIGNYESVIIQINGGGSNPSSLEERELFINTSTGELYYGNTSKAVNSVVAAKAYQVGSDKDNFYVSSKSTTAKLGPLSINSDQGVVLINGTLSGGTLRPQAIYGSVSTTVELFKGSVTNLTSAHVSASTLRIDNVILTSKSYGTSDPSTAVTNPTEGQIYFKIS